jgi:hypothetical protein
MCTEDISAQGVREVLSMSEKRMFAKQIVESDSFLDMPLSTQALYFHLSMYADDDGFLNAPKRIQRTIGATDDDLKLLIAKNFVIPFETGVMVIKHWKINNYIRSDRYKGTAYTDEKSMLMTKENGVYSLGIPSGYQVDTSRERNGSIDKNRLDKNRLNKCSSRGGKVNVLKKLTQEETENLFATYEDADYLIDEVENEINLKMKGAEIDNFYRYIIGYATKRGWMTIGG